MGFHFFQLSAVCCRLLAPFSPLPESLLLFTQTLKHSDTQTLLCHCRAAACPDTLVPGPCYVRQNCRIGVHFNTLPSRSLYELTHDYKYLRQLFSCPLSW